MVIEKDKMVSLTYTLRENDIDGAIVEEVDKSNPLQFLFGAGQMLANFEGNLVNLKEGDSFKFGLSADEAYGEKREELVVDIPRHVFEVDGTLDESICSVGNQVPMADAQGRRLLGIVLEIKDEDVDKALKFGYNLPMGPLELGDLLGSWKRRFEMIEDKLAALGPVKGQTHPIIREMVRAGYYGGPGNKGIYDFWKEVLSKW